MFSEEKKRTLCFSYMFFHQDCFRGMAFPHGLGNLPMPQKDLMSLIGETMNLASCSAFVGAILASESADWWAPVSPPNDNSEAVVAQSAPVKVRRMF